MWRGFFNITTTYCTSCLQCLLWLWTRSRKGHCNLPNACVIVHNLQAKAEPLMKDMLVLCYLKAFWESWHFSLLRERPVIKFLQELEALIKTAEACRWYIILLLVLFCHVVEVAVVLLPSLLSVCCLQVGPNILKRACRLRSRPCKRRLVPSCHSELLLSFVLLGGEGSLAEGRGCD